jgi:carbonic anhydrase
LTTPPCSEGVSWYVRRTPTQLSKDQIAAFTALYDHGPSPMIAESNPELLESEWGKKVHDLVHAVRLDMS